MNNKTLAVILHYNTTKYTDTLYELMKPYESEDYDLIVLDNGSDLDKKSKYNTYRLDTNLYYGGGLDYIFDLFIKDNRYDSLIVLNSDLIIQGKNFIKEMRKQLFNADLHILSPCIIQPELNQPYWPQMHCWNSTELRYVKWVDYTCVLLRRQFIETVKAFGSSYGWVQDIMSGIICANNGWKIAVADWIPVVHIRLGTIKNNSHLSNYNQLAEKEMREYFQKKGLYTELLEWSKWARAYSYNI